MLATVPLTREDVERLGAAGERMELIDGELREKGGVSQRHGEIEVQLTIPLGTHVFANGLGRIYPSDTQFAIFRDPDVIVIPDLAFVRADRVPPEAERWHIAPFAPDLAVEVISPSTALFDRLLKYSRYAAAGIAHYWIIDPVGQSLTAYELGPDGTYIELAHVTSDEAFAATRPVTLTVVPGALIAAN